ncbi:MAG: hypothetical protein AAF218_03210 [Pseudomonadota bacterium]
MISNVNSAFMTPGAKPSTTQLSDEQTKTLDAILSDVNPEELDQTAATKIVAEIEEAGIAPSAGLASALADNGIDPRALADLAGLEQGRGAGPAAGGPPGGGGGPGGPRGAGGGPGGGGGGGAQGAQGAGSVDAAVVSLFEDAASIYEADETGLTFAEIIAERLESEGMDSTKSAVDYYS